MSLTRFKGMERRTFLEGSFAAAALAAVPVVAVEPKGPVRLKLGVLSDIHITDWAATEPFKAVLREFDSWGADGVMVCGDLADYGVVPQLECVAKAWFEVFPDGKGRDGRPVANLMHYGDHDTRGSTYRRCKPCVKMFPDEEEMKKVIIRLNDRKAIWEKCFREPWAPIVHKRVKGYDFVLSHFTQGEKGNERGDNTPGLEKFMAGLKLDPRRPFFHSQHRVYRNTACGPYVWGQEDGSSGALFAAKYPNVIAFCGHAHQCAVNDQCVWQGAFTAIEVPSLRYCVTLGGRENGFSLFDRETRHIVRTMPEMGVGEGYDFTRQGYFVTVYDNCMVVRRREFKYGVSLGPDWVIPFPAPGDRPYAFEARRKVVPAPQFPAGAAVTVKEIRAKDRLGEERDMYELTFQPAASTASTPRANEYEVRVEQQTCDVVKTVATRRFYPMDYIYGAEKKQVVCRMLKSDVPADLPSRFIVNPMNSYYTRGRPIMTDFEVRRKEA